MLNYSGLCNKGCFCCNHTQIKKRSSESHFRRCMFKVVQVLLSSMSVLISFSLTHTYKMTLSLVCSASTFPSLLSIIQVILHSCHLPSYFVFIHHFFLLFILFLALAHLLFLKRVLLFSFLHHSFFLFPSRYFSLVFFTPFIFPEGQYFSITSPLCVLHRNLHGHFMLFSVKLPAE